MLLIALSVQTMLSAQESTALPFSIDSLQQVMLEETADPLSKYIYMLYDVDGDGRDELFVKEKEREYNTYWGFAIKDNKGVEHIFSRSSGGYEDFGFTEDGFLWHYEEHTGGLSQWTSYYKLRKSSVLYSVHESVEMPSADEWTDDVEIGTEYQVYMKGRLFSNKESDYHKYAPKGMRTSLYDIDMEDWIAFPADELARLAGESEITRVYGDLNKDGVNDEIVIETPHDRRHIVVREDDGYEYNLNQPILTISFSEGGEYKLFRQYDNVIPHPEDETEFVDCQVSVTNKGVLRISFSIWFSMGSYETSEHTYLYRYQDGDFYLIGESYDTSSRSSGDYEKVSINYNTNKKQITKGNNFKENDKPVETWTTFAKQPLEVLGAKNLKE